MNSFLIIPNIDYTLLHLSGQANIPNYKHQKTYEILNVIITNRNKIQLKESEDDTYTSINHINFKSISNDYKAYINLLISFEIIKCDGIFTPNVKSLGYCINWRSLSFFDALPVQFIECKKRISNYKEEDVYWEVNELNVRNSRNLVNPSFEYWLSKLNIDFPKSLALASELLIHRKYLPDTKQVFIAPNKGQIRGREETREKNRFNQLSIELLNAKLISCNIFELKRDSNIYRVHTTLSKLNKKYRHLLSIDGKKLVSLDLASSQPFLLLSLLNPGFWTFSDEQLNLATIGFTEKDIEPQKIHSIISLLSKSSPMEDVKGYTELVCNGNLYQSIHEIIHNTSVQMTAEDKENIKRVFFKILYASNYSKSDRLSIFKKHFPTIYELVNLIKRKDKDLLSKILQRLESFLFIDIIANRIISDHPNIPVLTIHDSIYTTVGNEDTIEVIVRDEIAKYTGFIPSLNIESS
jgi:hypothetical protein